MVASGGAGSAFGEQWAVEPCLAGRKGMTLKLEGVRCIVRVPSVDTEYETLFTKGEVVCDAIALFRK